MGNGNQFDGIGFAPGVVRGARSFDVDVLGRLTGIHYKQVWRPGENTAECRKRESDTWGGTFLNSLTISYVEEAIYGRKRKPVPKVEPEKPKPHSMETCACGFYGYYDNSNDYYAKGRVSGIVEGYGETLIGTRGFRCGKARIVALCINGKVDEWLAGLLRRNYGDVPMFDSFKSMVSEYPCDGGELAISPTSDPDFWTRTV